MAEDPVRIKVSQAPWNTLIKIFPRGRGDATNNFIPQPFAARIRDMRLSFRQPENPTYVAVPFNHETSYRIRGSREIVAMLGTPKVILGAGTEVELM